MKGGRRMFVSRRAVTQTQSIIIAVVVLVAVVGTYYFFSEPDQSVDGFQYVTPEEVGWSSQKLDSVKQLAEESGYAAIMAAYDGKVFFSWGEITTNFFVHSIRKPFESALYGIHVGQGEINLDETLEQLGIDDIPPSLTSMEKQATVRELLQARSGVYHEAAAEASSMIELRPPRGSHPHGTFYYYNNWDFNVAITIFEQKTGLDSLQAFKTEIADPIGMQDFSLADCSYKLEPEKSQHPATQIRMSARDMIRFGVLYQKGGNWLGQQIIPPAWITESTASYSVLDSDSGVGYGYMWNTIPAGTPAAQMVGSSGFYHTGVGVQALIILPELKLVIVELMNTGVPTWVDPGEIGMQLGLEIINAHN
jgi:CubicO group peptidase (beta-lactamase class C family)